MRNPPYGSLFNIGGVRIIENQAVGDAYEDWSAVRSHGRATRRLKRGFPQRIVTRYRPNGKVLHDKVRNVIYIHPVDRIHLERELRHLGLLSGMA